MVTECDVTADCGGSVWRVASAGARTLLARRPEGGRRWVLCFALTFCLVKAIDSGSGSVIYLFYRLQYNLSSTDVSNLGSIYIAIAFLAQVLPGTVCPPSD